MQFTQINFAKNKEFEEEEEENSMFTELFLEAIWERNIQQN